MTLIKGIVIFLLGLVTGIITSIVIACLIADIDNELTNYRLDDDRR